MKANEGIDLNTLARHVETMIAAGIHGLIPLGSTGEFYALSAEERRAVLLTDGFVGKPGASASQTLGSAVLGVALTPGNRLRTDLEAYTRHWAQLQEGQRP